MAKRPETQEKHRALVECFFELHDIKRMRDDDVEKILAQKFFIKEATVHRLMFRTPANTRYYDYLRAGGKRELYSL